MRQRSTWSNWTVRWETIVASQKCWKIWAGHTKYCLGSHINRHLSYFISCTCENTHSHTDASFKFELPVCVCLYLCTLWVWRNPHLGGMTVSPSRLTIGYLWSDLALCAPWLAEGRGSQPKYVTLLLGWSHSRLLPVSVPRDQHEGSRAPCPAGCLRVSPLSNTPIPFHIVKSVWHPAHTLWDPAWPLDSWFSAETLGLIYKENRDYCLRMLTYAILN